MWNLGVVLLHRLHFCYFFSELVSIYYYVALLSQLPQESPFGSLWYSIMTIIVYTVGGPDNIMLDLDNDWSEDHFLFPVASYLLWIIFIVAMSVLFLNLLVLHQGINVQNQHCSCCGKLLWGNVYTPPIRLTLFYMPLFEYA